MSSVQQLREFVTERLTAAAEEILGVFVKTMVEYQAEIERQRTLLDVVWKPEIQLHRLELSHQHKEEELPTDRLPCNQERNLKLSLDQEEQEDVCSSHEEEQHVLKQETETFVLNPTYEESDHQLLSDSSPVAERQDQEGAKHAHSESSKSADSELQTRRGSCAHNSVIQSNGGTGETSLQCGCCGKAFTAQSKLNLHLRVHTGETRHVCKTCGKTFVRESTLNNHVRTHTGETPHLCVTCGKIFKDKSKLKRHRLIHTGEKPYVCGTCGNRFIERSKLNRHMVLHTDCRPYSCDACGRRFKDTSTLNRHLKIHTGQRPFLCKTCGKRFIRTTHLRKHMNVHTRRPVHV